MAQGYRLYDVRKIATGNSEDAICASQEISFCTKPHMPTPQQLSRVQETYASSWRAGLLHRQGRLTGVCHLFAAFRCCCKLLDSTTARQTVVQSCNLCNLINRLSNRHKWIDCRGHMAWWSPSREKVMTSASIAFATVRPDH